MSSFAVASLAVVSTGLVWLALAPVVYVARLDVDERLFAQFRQILSQRRLQFLHVDGVLKLGADFVKGGMPALMVFGHFQDDEALLGSDHVRRLRPVFMAKV